MPSPSVIWSDVVQGRFLSDADTKPSNVVHWYEGSSIQTPSNAIMHGYVDVQPTDAADDSVGINETGPVLILQ
jgi:hypothetical protein